MHPTSALDPCCGTGAALHALTGSSNTTLYGVELDANRAESAKANGIQTIQGNVFDVRARVERFSFLYLNPPYDFEVGPRANERMEKLFLGHTYAWLKPKGVLLMVIPCKAVHDVSDTLSTRFKDIAIYRLVGEESEKYDQCAIFGNPTQQQWPRNHSVAPKHLADDVLPEAATSTHARSRSDV